MGEPDRHAGAESPEVVSYLAMGLTASPALDRAMAFAAEHAQGPLAEAMRGALWDLYLRGRTRVEDAFLSVADAWSDRDPEVKRAIYGIVHAVRDGAPEALSRGLDRARARVFDGTRRRMRDFAASLRGPTTALFALGVLLPLIVSSMVPMLSMGTFSPSSVTEAVREPGNPIPWILLLDVAFPAITFAFAHTASSRRPVASGEVVLARRILVGLASVPLALLIALIIPGPSAPILALGIFVVGVSVGLISATRAAVEDRRRRENMEREFPDALYQLGSRLEEGHGLEPALLAVAEMSQGTGCADLFRAIVHALRFGGSTVDDALFGPGGVLERTPSRMIRASLRLVTELARRDPATAGRAALEMSSHLRDLHGVEQDLRAELRPTMDSLRATAMLFAPAVLGVSSSLYGILFRAFASNASLPMTPPVLAAALGIYLVLTAAGILWFVSRVGREGRVGFAHRLGRGLPVAYAVFLVAVFASGSAL